MRNFHIAPMDVAEDFFPLSDDYSVEGVNYHYMLPGQMVGGLRPDGLKVNSYAPQVPTDHLH